MGFVFIRKAVLDGCAGRSQSLAMDLHDQYVYMEKTTQWRFTPPTHVVVALAEAIAQFEEEGGQPARLARYESNYRTLVTGMGKLGFTLAGADHPIIPVMLGDAALAQEMAARMLQRGIYVIGFSFPVVPKGQARIRTQMSAAHSFEDIDRAVAAFGEVGRELGVIR